MDEALAGMKDYRKIVDNVVVFDQDEQAHVEHVRHLSQRCKEKNISLNREKFRFCQTEVPFAGFILTSDGYSISNDITAAISNFPTPSSLTDLRSFFGLMNQLASSTSQIANILTPLRPLLSSCNDFMWMKVHEKAFHKVKEALTTAPTLA